MSSDKCIGRLVCHRSYRACVFQYRSYYTHVHSKHVQVKELHCAARHAYLTQRELGKPRQGDVFTMMKLSRSKFKFALRKCKRDKMTIITDNIAENLCKKRQS